MKILSLAELRKIISRHPDLRLNMIPLKTGLLVDGRYMFIADAEGQLKGIDMQGIEEIFNG